MTTYGTCMHVIPDLAQACGLPYPQHDGLGHEFTPAESTSSDNQDATGDGFDPFSNRTPQATLDQRGKVFYRPGRLGLPRLNVSNAPKAARELRGVFGSGPTAGVFLRGGQVVTVAAIGEEGYIVETETELKKRISHGPAQVRQMTEPSLRAMLGRVYDIGVRKEREVKKGEDEHGNPITRTEPQWDDRFLPRDVVSQIFNDATAGACPGLRYVTGVTHTPVLRPNGTVLDVAGYDAVTGLLYLPEKGLNVPKVSNEPTTDELTRARDLLLRPVEQFPFVSEDDRAGWAGAMLSPIVQRYLGGTPKFVIIDATNAGSGKTLLETLIGIVHGMTMQGDMPRDEDELRKRMVALLVNVTAPVIGFDNLKGSIGSGWLEAFLSGHEISDRLLGSSTFVTVINDRLIIATGNNARVTGDMARRTLMIHLDPGLDKAYKRTGFDIPDLDSWMREHRGEYLWALLTLARGWIVAGAPQEQSGGDGFSRWQDGIRGLLKWANAPGVFGGNEAGSGETESADDADWGLFLAELYRVYKDGTFTSRELMADVSTVNSAGVQAEKLPDQLAHDWGRAGGSTPGLVKSMGNWLSYRKGRVAGGMRVVVASGSAKKGWRYRVEASAAAIAEISAESDK